MGHKWTMYEYNIFFYTYVVVFYMAIFNIIYKYMWLYVAVDMAVSTPYMATYSATAVSKALLRTPPGIVFKKSCRNQRQEKASNLHPLWCQTGPWWGQNRPMRDQNGAKSVPRPGEVQLGPEAAKMGMRRPRWAPKQVTKMQLKSGQVHPQGPTSDF